jgi:hypothetical protein
MFATWCERHRHGRSCDVKRRLLAGHLEPRMQQRVLSTPTSTGILNLGPHNTGIGNIGAFNTGLLNIGIGNTGALNSGNFHSGLLGSGG